jgi:hypothetical protein
MILRGTLSREGPERRELIRLLLPISGWSKHAEEFADAAGAGTPERPSDPRRFRRRPATATAVDQSLPATTHRRGQVQTRDHALPQMLPIPSTRDLHGLRNDSAQLKA